MNDTPEETSSASEHLPATPKQKDRTSIVPTLFIVGIFILLILTPTVFIPWLDSYQKETSQDSSKKFIGIDEYAPKEGYRAPLFTLTDSEENIFSLESFRGEKPVVLIFEASWCGYCKKESDTVESLRNTYGDQIEIVTVDQAEDKATVNQYRSQSGIERPWLLDVDRQVSTLYNSFSTPSHFFISKDGYIVDLWLGYLEEADLERYMLQLI